MNILKSFINISTDVTTIYGRTSKIIYSLRLKNDLSCKNYSVLEKNRLVTFLRRWSAPGLSPIGMNGSPLEEASCLEWLLGLKVVLDIKLNSYTWSIPKDLGKMFGSLYCSTKYVNPPVILDLYKFQIRQKCSTVVIFVWAVSTSYSAALIESKSVPDGGDFFFTNLSPTGRM